jgi:hypothetical protein
MTARFMEPVLTTGEQQNHDTQTVSYFTGKALDHGFFLFLRIIRPPTSTKFTLEILAILIAFIFDFRHLM